MGLSSAQNSSMSALSLASNRLGLVADNISHAEDPNYSRKINNPINRNYGDLSQRVSDGSVERQLDQNLQKLVLDLSGSAAASQITKRYAEHIQSIYGAPGDELNLSATYNQFSQKLTELTASPESDILRSETILYAENITTELQKGAESTLAMFRTVEQEIISTVNKLNSALDGLKEVNYAIRQSTDGTSARANALDQKDKLIAEIGSIIPIKSIEQNNETFSLITKTGITLIDAEPVQFTFKPREVNQAEALFEDLNNTTISSPLTINDLNGALSLNTPHLLGKGELGALFNIRDNILPQTLAQLDDIAHSLATALNHKETNGAAISTTGGDGFDLDTSDLVSGNRINLRYTENGITQTLSVVRVDDAASLPIENEVLTGNHKVIGVDFSNGLGDVATALNTALGGSLTFSDQGGNVLRVLDDGAANTINIETAKTKTTITDLSEGDLGLPFFVDVNQTAYTDNQDGIPQRLGFSSRISINQTLKDNPESLVIFQDNASGKTLPGDDSRPKAIMDRLSSITLELSERSQLGSQHPGSAASMQAIFTSALNKTSSETEAAQRYEQSQTSKFEIFSNQFNETRAVSMDEELSMLTQLEQYYAINARVLSVIKEMYNIMLQGS